MLYLKKKKKKKSCLSFCVLIDVDSKLCFLWFPVASLCAAIYKCMWIVNVVCTSKSDCAHTHTHKHISSWVLFSFLCCHHHFGAEPQGSGRTVVISPQGLMDSSIPHDLVHHLVDTVKNELSMRANHIRNTGRYSLRHFFFLLFTFIFSYSLWKVD